MTEAVPPGSLDVAFRDLRPGDDRRAFDCGNDTISGWFRDQAGQALRKGSAATTIGVDVATSEIVSFYALVAHQLGPDGSVEPRLGVVRRYPRSAILIAQLGVGLSRQGSGVGKATLEDALNKLSTISASVGFEVVVVDAIDVRASAFYRTKGFFPLTSDVGRLELTIHELRRIAADGRRSDH